MADQDDKAKGRWARFRLWKYLPLAFLLIGVGIAFVMGLHRTLSFETFLHHQGRVRDLVAQNHTAMLGLYVLIYVAAVTLSLPVSAFLTAIGGYLFGWLLGGAAASLSSTLGATSLFLIARTSLGSPLQKRAESRILALAAGFRRQAFSYLLSLRLMPAIPFWLTNLAAALFGMRLRSYILATWLGMLPICFAFAFAGSGLDEVVARHEEVRQQCLAVGGGNCAIAFSAGSLLTPDLLIALSALGILALAPAAVRFWQARGSRDKD